MKYSHTLDLLQSVVIYIVCFYCILVITRHLLPHIETCYPHTLSHTWGHAIPIPSATPTPGGMLASSCFPHTFSHTWRHSMGGVGSIMPAALTLHNCPWYLFKYQGKLCNSKPKWMWFTTRNASCATLYVAWKKWRLSQTHRVPENVVGS